MTALKIIGCIFLFFAFIFSLKAKVILEYSDELTVSVRVLFLKYKILPKKQKKGPHSMSEKKAQKIKEDLRKKALKKQQKKQKKQAKKREDKQQSDKKKSVDDILHMISMVKDILSAALGRFFKHLRVDIARLNINVATGDAATTAIGYGAVCDALTHLLPLLEQLKGFRASNSSHISVRADYLSDSTTADLKISLSLRVWHVFHVAFAALWQLIKHMLTEKIKKQSKP